MPLTLNTRAGRRVTNPSDPALRRAVQELFLPGPDEPEAYAFDEAGRTLLIDARGRVLLSNLDGSPRTYQLRRQSADQMFALWSALARGDLDTLRGQPWEVATDPVPTDRAPVPRPSAHASPAPSPLTAHVAPVCRYCTLALQRGFVLDYTDSSRVRSQWHPGEPEPGFLGPKPSHAPRVITTYRCPACGYLEQFAP